MNKRDAILAFILHTTSTGGRHAPDGVIGPEFSNLS